MQIATWATRFFYLLLFLCLLSPASRILLFCIVSTWAMVHSPSLPFPTALRNDLKEPHRIRFCEHFLQIVPCKFIVLRTMMLHTTRLCAGPVFQKGCKNTCIAVLPPGTAAVRCATTTNVQEMSFACGARFLSFLTTRKVHY